MPQISIIVPVFNVEHYIHDCLKSILQQTFTDYELILVDDGSSDNSGQICDEYAKQDNRIHVIHQKNKGLSAARNIGISNAKGQYICFVDSDDLIHAEMLELMYNAVVQSDSDISICLALEDVDCPDSFREKIIDVQPIVKPLNDETIYNLKKIAYAEHVAWGKLLKTEIVRNNLFEIGRFYEDTVTFKWMCEAKKIAIVCKELYFYRINPNGITKTEVTLKKAMDGLWAVSERLRWAREYKYEKLEKYYLSRFLYESANAYFLAKRDYKLAKKIKSEALIEWVKNRKNVQFKAGEKVFVMEMFFPMTMWIYWKRKKIFK